MKNFLYMDEATGEYFYVQAATRKEADEIANDNFDDPIFRGIDSDEEAEASGLDTY